jgi:HK97 family phage portal protein
MAFWNKRSDVTAKTTQRTSVVPMSTQMWLYRSFNGNFLQLDLIATCIDALARNIGKIELKSIMRKKDNVSVSDLTSDVARVLKNPNPYMTSYDFLYKIASLYFISNNVFIWPEYDPQGNLIALWPINYTSFQLKATESGILIAQFQLNYFKLYTVPYSQLIHLRNKYTTDDLFGDSNDALAPVAELTNAQNQGIINGIKNSALIRGILKSVNVIKEEDMVKARDKFVEDNLSASNSGGVMVIDGKFDYQNIESKPYVVDADTMQEVRQRIYSYFGVNDEFIQNKFTSEQYEAVYEGRIEPFAMMVSQAFTAKLFTARERGFGNEVEANMAKLKYQPMTVITRVITATNQLGLFTRDEYREMLGYEPLGPKRGGDEIMIAVNNMAVDENMDKQDEKNEKKKEDEDYYDEGEQ